MPPPPALPDELLEEIFLRLPPDEPASLIRASLASKSWHALLTGPRFRRLYRDFHGAPPMLGFIYSCPQYRIPADEDDNLPYFTATAKFSVRIPSVEDWRGWHRDYVARDCRHGRVLFSNTNTTPMQLVVWDPMTGRRRLLYAPEEDYDTSGAAVLCGVAGCDHRACHASPFQVVFVGLSYTDDGIVAYARVSLPEEVGKWTKPCSRALAAEEAFIVDRPPVFIRDALYFMLAYGDGGDDDGDEEKSILKYDLVSNCLSLIDVPPVKTGLASDLVLMAMEDGSLGFAYRQESTLFVWSTQMGSDGVAAWTRRRVIDLKNLLPIQRCREVICLIGSVEGSDVIFVSTYLGIYKIDLKSVQQKKISSDGEYMDLLIPYMSFYNPREKGKTM